jgi:Ca2+-binding RTX toxin-like protein
MAVVTLSSSFNFASTQDWAWEVSSANASSLVLIGTIYKQTFSGNFTYDAEDVIYGTVSATSFYINNVLVYSITGMASNATQLQAFAETVGDTQETYAYILQSSDTINGSVGNDTLLGYAGNDVINGGAGNDTIDGGTGNDTINGDAGNDTINGGTGTDTIVFSGNYAAASIQYSAANATFTVTTATGGTDTVTGVETLTFADQSVTAASLIAALDPAPTVSTFSPSSSATGVLTSANIVITFSENIQRGTGTITLQTAGGDFVESFNAASSPRLTITGNTLTIDPLFELQNNTHYVLNIQSGNIKDMTGNAYAGTSSYDFSTPTLVSATAAGIAGNDDCVLPNGHASYSSDGRYVIFDSFASNLVAGDNNAAGYDWAAIYTSASDVFIKDLQTGSITCVSTSDASMGTPVMGNSDSFFGSFSGDGRYVVFESDANNLTWMEISSIPGAHSEFPFPNSPDAYWVAGDRNTHTDVFVKDLLTGTIKIASADVNGLTHLGSSCNASISFDGRYVVFESTLSDEFGITSDANGAAGSIYLKDMQTGSIRQVDTNSAGVGANFGGIFHTSISSDGRYVVFDSGATNLTAGDLNNQFDVFVKDLQTGTVSLISSNSANVASNALSENGSFSADGRYVVFESIADNLVAGDTNAQRDIFVKNLQTGETRLVSSNAAGVAGNAASSNAQISADGHYVLFNSGADNLASEGEDFVAWEDVFIKDLQTGAIKRVANNAINAAFSADGQSIVFTGMDTDNNVYQVSNPFSLMLTGDASANTLTGGSGNDTLDGKAAADTMVGAAGNDIYYVDNAGDTITEAANEGTDKVFSTISFTLVGKDNIENLTLTGSANINATGNSLGNILAGNSGDNILDGGAGNDTINGDAGNDRFVAGSSDGNDAISGGAGYDILDFSAAGGGVQVNQLTGTTTGSAGSDTLLDHIEEVIGSNFADILIGSDTNDVLNGGGGNDKLYGNKGSDTYRGDAGDDTFYFSDSDGDDSLAGGMGFDTLDFSNLNGVVQANQFSGVTTGTAGNDTLVDIFEMLIGTRFGDVLAGGNGGDGLKGGAGADQMWGNAGDDWMSGGDGNDRLKLGQGNDTVDFRNGDDIDTIVDFNAGAGSPDKLQFKNYSGLGTASLAGLQSQGRIAQVGADTQIALNGGDMVILLNVLATNLHADDFIFA